MNRRKKTSKQTNLKTNGKLGEKCATHIPDKGQSSGKRCQYLNRGCAVGTERSELIGVYCGSGANKTCYWFGIKT